MFRKLQSKIYVILPKPTTYNVWPFKFNLKGKWFYPVAGLKEINRFEQIIGALRGIFNIWLQHTSRLNKFSKDFSWAVRSHQLAPKGG